MFLEPDQAHWVITRTTELLRSEKFRFGDVYRQIPARVVYLLSASSGTTQLPYYVGVTTQKVGRFNAHIHDKRSGVWKGIHALLEKALGRLVSDSEVETEVRGLNIQWIEEEDKTRQERIEHYVCALHAPILNRIGRAAWGTGARL